MVQVSKLAMTCRHLDHSASGPEVRLDSRSLLCGCAEAADVNVDVWQLLQLLPIIQLGEGNINMTDPGAFSVRADKNAISDFEYWCAQLPNPSDKFATVTCKLDCGCFCQCLDAMAIIKPVACDAGSCCSIMSSLATALRHRP